MKKKLFFAFGFPLLCLACSCNSNSNGKGSVMEESNKDDYYQMRGYGDSLPSDSLKEEVRQDSIRIWKSGHHNK